MIRISRLTDYGIVLMTYMATHPDRVQNAAEVAAGARLPLPTVSKLLRLLARQDLLVSHRGAKGGYTLARPAEWITVAEIIGALEGPIGLTLCTAETPSACEHQSRCAVHGHWQGINRAIRQTLESVTLAEMASPTGPRFLVGGDAGSVESPTLSASGGAAAKHLAN